THLGRLVSLNLSGCELTANGLAALSLSSQLSGLRTLQLSSIAVGRNELFCNRLGDFGAAQLARSPCLTRLTRLQLRQVHVGAEGVEALANSEAMRTLRALDLMGNPVGDRGVRALLQSPYLGQLQTLCVTDMTGARIGAWSKRALSERFGEGLIIARATPP